MTSSGFILSLLHLSTYFYVHIKLLFNSRYLIGKTVSFNMLHSIIFTDFLYVGVLLSQNLLHWIIIMNPKYNMVISTMCQRLLNSLETFVYSVIHLDTRQIVWSVTLHLVLICFGVIVLETGWNKKRGHRFPRCLVLYKDEYQMFYW